MGSSTVRMTLSWHVPIGRSRSVTVALHSLMVAARGEPGFVSSSISADVSNPRRRAIHRGVGQRRPPAPHDPLRPLLSARHPHRRRDRCAVGVFRPADRHPGDRLSERSPRQLARHAAPPSRCGPARASHAARRAAGRARSLPLASRRRAGSPTRPRDRDRAGRSGRAGPVPRARRLVDAGRREGGARLESDRGRCRRSDDPAGRTVHSRCRRHRLDHGSRSAARRRHRRGRAPGAVDPRRTGRSAPLSNPSGHQRLSRGQAARGHPARPQGRGWRHGGVRGGRRRPHPARPVAPTAVVPLGAGARRIHGHELARHRARRANRRHDSADVSGAGLAGPDRDPV